MKFVNLYDLTVVAGQSHDEKSYVATLKNYVLNTDKFMLVAVGEDYKKGDLYIDHDYSSFTAGWHHSNWIGRRASTKSFAHRRAL